MDLAAEVAEEVRAMPEAMVVPVPLLLDT